MPAPREPEPIVQPPPLTDGQLRAKRWAANGATFGFILGAVCAVLFLGSGVRDLGVVDSALLIAAGAVFGMIVGYLALTLAMSGQAAPPSIGVGGGESDSGGSSE